MRIGIIENHTDRLGAPTDWDHVNGRCSALHIRRENMGGVMFMRSSWEPDADEIGEMLAGGKLVLGIAGPVHPVVNMCVEAAPDNSSPPLTVRQLIRPNGERYVRVTMFCNRVRMFAEQTLEGHTLGAAVAVAIDAIEKLAGETGS